MVYLKQKGMSLTWRYTLLFMASDYQEVTLAISSLLQQGRIEHAEDHGYVGYNQEYGDERGMESEGRLFINLLANDAKTHECQTTQRNNAQQIKTEGDHIGNTTPAACGQRNHSIEQKVEENTGEVDADDDTCDLIPLAQFLVLPATKQNVQLGDRNRFGEDDRNRHKNNEVPRLVGRQELHIVGHRVTHVYAVSLPRVSL